MLKVLGARDRGVRSSKRAMDHGKTKEKGDIRYSLFPSLLACPLLPLSIFSLNESLVDILSRHFLGPTSDLQIEVKIIVCLHG